MGLSSYVWYDWQFGSLSWVSPALCEKSGRTSSWQSSFWLWVFLSPQALSKEWLGSDPCICPNTSVWYWCRLPHFRLWSKDLSSWRSLGTLLMIGFRRVSWSLLCIQSLSCLSRIVLCLLALSYSILFGEESIGCLQVTFPLVKELQRLLLFLLLA